MDYTQSNAFATHAGTGNRMHNASQATPTAVSDADLNGLTWEVLSVIKQAGLTPAAFDPNSAASYQQLMTAIAALQRQQTNTAYTTAGTAPAFTVTLPASAVALAALGANLRLRLKFHAAGTGNDTLAIGSLAAKSLKQYNSAGAKVAGVIAAGQLVDVEYDGADFVLLDPLPSDSPSASRFVGASVRNLYRDSGRCFDAEAVSNAGQVRQVAMSAAFSTSKFADSLYNGCSVSNAGKFIHDNSSSGGSGAALPTVVDNFMTAIRGAGNYRYGVEFYIAEFLQGSSPSVWPTTGGDGATRWLAFCTTLTVSLVTFSCWIQAVTGSVLMSSASHRNGSPSSNTIVNPADGWVHLSSINDGGTAGYVMPGLCSTAGARFRVALPLASVGDISGFVPRSPVAAQSY